MRRSLLAVASGLGSLLLTPILLAPLLFAAPADAAPKPIEPYAKYVPATHCSPKPKPGTLRMAAWVMRTYHAGRGPIGRACSHGRATSEHNEGRAFDAMLSIHRAKDRAEVKALFGDLLATDAAGNPAALARRMGVMYLIWDDHLYGAWNQFAPEPYLDSSCPSVKKCSDTLRHRDHVHISLSRAGGWGMTSWYAD